MFKILSLTSVFTLILLVLFSVLVAKDEFTSIDFNTTVKLQDNLPRSFDLPFSFFSIIGSAEVAGAIWLLMVILLMLRRYYLTVAAFMFYILGIIVELIGKLVINHPSPPHLFYRGVINFDLPSSYVQTGNSFPSGHVFRTAFLITFLLSWIYIFKPAGKMASALFLLTFLAFTVISRIYLGEHWTTDVIGGLLLGFGLGLIPAATLTRYQK